MSLKASQKRLLKALKAGDIIFDNNRYLLLLEPPFLEQHRSWAVKAYPLIGSSRYYAINNKFYLDAKSLIVISEVKAEPKALSKKLLRKQLVKND